MKIYIEEDSTGRVTGWSSSPFSASAIEIELLEEDHSFFAEAAIFFRHIDGKLVYDEELARKAEEEEKQSAEAEKRKNEIIKNLEAIIQEKDKEIAALNAKVDSVTRTSNDILSLMMGSI